MEEITLNQEPTSPTVAIVNPPMRPIVDLSKKDGSDAVVDNLANWLGDQGFKVEKEGRVLKSNGPPTELKNRLQSFFGTNEAKFTDEKVLVDYPEGVIPPPKPNPAYPLPKQETAVEKAMAGELATGLSAIPPTPQPSLPKVSSITIPSNPPLGGQAVSWQSRRKEGGPLETIKGHVVDFDYDNENYIIEDTSGGRWTVPITEVTRVPSENPPKKWRGSDVQSVIFDKQKWDVQSAKDWLKRHDFKYGDVDEKAGVLRFRQREPSEIKKGRFATIPFGNTGIMAVIGEPKDGEFIWKKNPPECEGCKHPAGVTLTMREATYHLCLNCLLGLVTHSLSKAEFDKIIKSGHSTKEFYLHDDFYTNGIATQPMLKSNPPESDKMLCPNCKTNPPLQIISEGPTRIGFGQTPAYEYIIANKNIPEIIVELKNLAYKKGWADPLVGSRGVNTSVIFKTKINPGTIPHIEKEALEIAEGNVYPRYFLVAWDVKKESFINEDEARTRKAELKKEGWSVRSRTVYFDDGYRIFLTAVKEKGSEQMLCPNCKNIVLEPIKTNPPGALRCPSCKKAWMPNPRHLSKGPSVPAPEKVLFLHPSFGGGYWIQNPPETPNPAGDECSWRGCGRPAIGYEASVARGLNVCEVHASKTLKEMKPGETKGTPSKGNYYVRYPEVR